MPTPPPLRVGIAGLGAVGRTVALALDEGIPGLALAAIATRDPLAARASIALKADPIWTHVDELSAHCDLVLECAPAALVPRIVRPVLEAGKTVVVLSCGALLAHPGLIDLAKATGGRIVVPSGATLGLDAVLAAAEGPIRSVTMVMRKTVQSLQGAAYLAEHGIRIDDLAEPLRVFRGSPREAAAGFAANLNVAVALSLAGIGPDRTVLEVWADPTIERNLQRIEVESDAATFSLEIFNRPSSHARTSRITALSVIALLRKMTAPLQVGT